MSKKYLPSRAEMIKLFKAFTPYDVEKLNLNELAELFEKTFGRNFFVKGE